MLMPDKLPIGIENFKKIRTNGFYYVDKTELIKELLINWGEVNLFTRPRRFGKSLNMSMLKYFFEYGCDRRLFEGLAISREESLCGEYMGKYPVISISLKGAGGESFAAAKAMMRTVIAEEAMRFLFLKESDNLEENERRQYRALIHVDDTGCFDIPDSLLENSLKSLSGFLEKHYGQKVILLIDEYDVPLDKAYQAGYYDQMVGLLRGMLGGVLKTNNSLQLAVLTGCLRISKESIFTGLNNLKVYSIADVRFDEYFGFTNAEVRDMLEYYGLSEHFGTVKEWYDGYLFGKIEVYCPWDVINFVDLLRADPEAWPQAYWVNSSGNSILHKFFQKSGGLTAKREIEQLIAGETVTKEIHMELTYQELDKSLANLWSVLFMTGYLTQTEQRDNGIFLLRIPNLEIRNIFTKQIYRWFEESAAKDGERLNAFCNALKSGDAAQVENRFNDYLGRTISIRDNFVKKRLKENFYHGILLGLISFKENWDVASNKESGEGYSDILIEIAEEETGIIIEVKYPDNKDIEAGSAAALAQIETLHYDEPLRMNGIKNILKYGIACYGKHCKVAGQCIKTL
ncbi:MAG: AAA family ATPase [Lachnospiraceae bacterium]|nr:AAA family ATPase [Lachnospiraceae bacterium]